MTPERWERISELYHKAQAYDVRERAAFLRDACAGDDRLRQEVESLLAKLESVQTSHAAPATAWAVDDAYVGREISHYRILSLLGMGGMGVVYRAEDVRLGRPVALKFISEDLAKDPQAVSRLRSEARAASALNHGNICTIYDIDEHEGQPFIAMELMKGQTLRDRLASGGPLKTHQLVDIGIQVADALDATHSQGVIHRDIKPANLFLTERHQVKILDFGVAKLSAGYGTHSLDQSTKLGLAVGTVAYMSPEQASGEGLDGRTDLFSLGVVLYECATGRQPFTGKTAPAVLAAILNRSPMAPGHFNAELPVRLQQVINNCLEKDRDLRCQSAADLRADLKRIRRDLESGRTDTVNVASPKISGAQSGTHPPHEPRGRASRIGWAAGALLGVVVLAAAAFYLISPGARTPVSEIGANAAAISEDSINRRLQLARSSFEARNYRDAVAYSTEVLAVDPNRPDAAKIRDEAQAMITRFDAAIDAARRHLDAGDVQGASKMLEAARSIDPVAASLSGISVRIAAQTKTQSEAVRPPIPAPQAPPPQARTSTTPSPSPAPAADTRPRTDVPTPMPAQLPPTQTAAAEVQQPAPLAPPEPVAPPKVAPAAPAPASADRVERQPPPAPAPPSNNEDDDAAIRRVVASYARAIENKDLTLYRTVKPNLSSGEERRLRDGFRAVSSQRVDLTILSVEIRGRDASIRVRRRDTIRTGAREQTTESQQVITMTSANGGWIITGIR